MRRFIDEVLRPAVKKPRGLPRLEAILDRWVAFLARELTRGCIMIAGAVEYDDRPGPAARRDGRDHHRLEGRAAEGDPPGGAEGPPGSAGIDAQQMVFEIYGLMLAMHQDARLLRSADSAKRARAGLRRLLDDAQAAAPGSLPVPFRHPPSARRRVHHHEVRSTAMPSYKAPLRDQQFVLHEVLGVVDAFEMPRYAELDVDTINQIVEEAGKFCEDKLLPINRSGDEEGCTYDPSTRSVRTPAGFKEAFDAFRQAGWQGLAAETEYGGQGLPHLLQIVFYEMQYSDQPGVGDVSRADSRCL